MLGSHEAQQAEVSSKNDNLSTKKDLSLVWLLWSASPCLWILHEVIDCFANGFKDMAMLHGCLIPKDDISFLDMSRNSFVFCERDVAHGISIDRDGYLEGGMGSSTAMQYQYSDSR